jgi:DNA-3-methyladenine glycosylase
MTEPLPLVHPAPLVQEFFARDCREVARDLLGCHLVRDDVVLRITEVEAYCGPTDTAAHTRSGRTARNAPMWGPPGRAYVYLCYGLHHMLNIVAGPEGSGSAVLIRACEPVAGEETIRARRGRSGPSSLSGPGKIGAALALDRTFNHHPLTEPGGLVVTAGTPPDAILVGPRVGIDYAAPADRDALWRYAVAGSRWVTRRKTLRER